jgi:hypothetical protein
MEKPKVIFRNLSSDGRSLTPNLVERAVNFRLTDDYVFANDIGFEPLKVYPVDDDHLYVDDDFNTCRFMKIWSRKNGCEVYYLQERNGKLYYELGNGDGENGVDRIILDTNRHQPGLSEVGTQLIPVGNYCILANGVNEPRAFYGKNIDRRFGPTRPSPPTVFAIDPAYVERTGTGLKFTTPAVAIRLTEYIDSDADGDRDTAQAVNSGWGITLFDEEDAAINYGYKVAFLYEDGSVGPLSSEATLDFYIDTDQSNCFVAQLQLPIGPSNVVGRVLYRTRQRGLSAGQRGSIEGGDYFEIKRVLDNTSEWATDHFPDTALNVYAPGYGNRPGELVVDLQNFNYGCIWDGRLWVSGGDYEDTVVWSSPGKIRQFEAANRATFNVGGRITALVPHDNSLYIFRENAIDIVSQRDDGKYNISSLTSSTGTIATNSIKAIPGIGLVFLSIDGFYVIAGGLPQKISSQIDDELKRLNLSALPRATAVWNPREKEYWCHFAVDGRTNPTLGAVFHANGFWTFREHDTPEVMSFTQLDFDGRYTIIGTDPYHSTTGSTISGFWIGVGLQVWSANNGCGTRLTEGTVETGGFNFTHVAGNRTTTTLETNWIFIEPTDKKGFHSVELMVKGIGNIDVPLSYAIDQRPVFTDVTPKVAKQPDNIITKYDAVYATSTGNDQAIWDTSIFNKPRSIIIRYDLNTKICNCIKFKIETEDLIAIEGMTVYITQDPMRNPR